MIIVLQCSTLLLLSTLHLSKPLTPHVCSCALLLLLRSQCSLGSLAWSVCWSVCWSVGGPGTAHATCGFGRVQSERLICQSEKTSFSLPAATRLIASLPRLSLEPKPGRIMRLAVARCCLAPGLAWQPGGAFDARWERERQRPNKKSIVNEEPWRESILLARSVRISVCSDLFHNYFFLHVYAASCSVRWRARVVEDSA